MISQGLSLNFLFYLNSGHNAGVLLDPTTFIFHLHLQATESRVSDQVPCPEPNPTHVYSAVSQEGLLLGKRG